MKTTVFMYSPLSRWSAFGLPAWLCMACGGAAGDPGQVSEVALESTALSVGAVRPVPAASASDAAFYSGLGIDLETELALRRGGHF